MNKYIILISLIALFYLSSNIDNDAFYNKNQSIIKFSLIKAEGGSLESFSETEVLFPSKCGEGLNEFLIRHGVDEKLNTKRVCSKKEIKVLLLELEKSIRLLLMYKGKYEYLKEAVQLSADSTFGSYLTEFEQNEHKELVREQNKLNLLLKKLFECLLASLTKKYSKLIFQEGSDCTVASYICNSSIVKISKMIVKALKIVGSGFSRQIRVCKSRNDKGLECSYLEYSLKLCQELQLMQQTVQNVGKDEKTRCKQQILKPNLFKRSHAEGIDLTSRSKSDTNLHFTGLPKDNNPDVVLKKYLSDSDLSHKNKFLTSQPSVESGIPVSKRVKSQEPEKSSELQLESKKRDGEKKHKHPKKVKHKLKSRPKIPALLNLMENQFPEESPEESSPPPSPQPIPEEEPLPLSGESSSSQQLPEELPSSSLPSSSLQLPEELSSQPQSQSKKPDNKGKRQKFPRNPKKKPKNRPGVFELFSSSSDSQVQQPSSGTLDIVDSSSHSEHRPRSILKKPSQETLNEKLGSDEGVSEEAKSDGEKVGKKVRFYLSE